MRVATSLPSSILARYYPSPTDPTKFPEMVYSGRYNPHSSGNSVGIALSGGGTRAFSCALGQVQALNARGALANTAAISCNSGGNWFGTVFTFAPEPGGIGNVAGDTPYTDAQLLGTPVPPSELDLGALSYNPPGYMGGMPASMTNTAFGASIAIATLAYELGLIREDQVWAYGLSTLLFGPYMYVGGVSSIMTLDASTRADLLKRNPSLAGLPVRAMRTGRPFLIVTGAQWYPTAQYASTRPLEYSPLYAGMPLFYPRAGINGTDLGGGYVETAGCDSAWPSPAGNSLVSVPVGAGRHYLFGPQDMAGSSSSAFAEYLVTANQLNPQFGLWPSTFANQAATDTVYDVIDGGYLDNLAILPLLRRTYPIIVSFTNTDIPLGVTTPTCLGTSSADVYQGVSTEISRLFGLGNVPADQPNIQVFDSADFAKVRDGLMATKASGSVPFYLGVHQIVPNQLGIPQHTVAVVWYYNDLSTNWKSQLHPDALHLLEQDPTFTNFPNYCTFQQNGELEVVWLRLSQVNMLANMWYNGITGGAAGEALDRALSGAI